MNELEVKPDTKQKILDSAENLFAEHGFAAVSLRSIIADANVNLAAIHYHYRSKEALFDAVILRRLTPINEERLALLDRYQRSARDGKPELEQVLDAFLAPVFRVGADPRGSTFVQLIGRIFSQEMPVFSQMIKKHFGPILERFIPAIQAAVPELPLPELMWRMLFLAGALTHTLRSSGQNLELVHGGMCNTSDLDGAMRRLIRFAAAGFRAPVSSGVTHA